MLEKIYQSGNGIRRKSYAGQGGSKKAQSDGIEFIIRKSAIIAFLDICVEQKSTR